MSALRKAGVWLGLVEEDDDRAYDDRGYRETSGYRERDRDSGYRYADEFADEDEEVEEPAPVQRTRPSGRERDRDRGPGRLQRAVAELEEEEERAAAQREERATVRPITRSHNHNSGSSNSDNYPTRGDLALAPQVQVHQRAAEEDQRYQITTLHPTTYREARTIGEHFRDGVPVIINLTEMDEGDARRLVDFAAGLAFGLRGTIERVTNRVFLLSPANVQVTAEDKAKIAEGGFFTQS
ncbi:cell division protein SepF [Actinoplanes sp. NPDC049265]|uniref:cell division protein SepF n=2 Tax=unclassified Actinoplanes TaxID=2626549 RepID=UPI003724C02A